MVPDHVELLEELGRGTTGIVWKARYKKIPNRIVALKTIVPRPGCDWKVQCAYSFREARAMASLLHDANILEVYEVGEIDGGAFCVREFVQGSTLEAFLRNGGPLSSRAAMNMVATLARTIQRVHDRDLIHRNLNLENILLAAKNTLKLIGFGRVGMLDNGNSSRSASLDISALGTILHATLTGTETRGEDLSQLPRDLANICEKCWDKPGTKRYESATALAEDLEALL